LSCTNTDDPSNLEPVITLLEATDITESSFKANWERLDDASDYVVTVFACTEGEPEKFCVDFTGGIAGLPADWVSSSSAVYNMAAYAGNAVPALRMTATGDMLESGEFTDGISAVRFWHRGNGSSTASNKILVEGRNNERWIELATLPVVTEQGGHTETISGFADLITAVRISYTGEAKGSIAVDDVEIYHGHSVETKPLDSWKSVSTGNAAELLVDNLDAQKDYCYEVTAIDADGKQSSPSDKIFVTTAASSGIRDIADDDACSGEARVCDLAGRIVAKGDYRSILNRLNAGIYILSSNGKTSKIIIKHKQ
ncbi:MAG: T9SS type A sorting domain-containing protein, partial [Muribaculaceae bacterium]|nr:T9SS type A sorting domain-containing protein [Muribaculaceae bacterium]